MCQERRSMRRIDGAPALKKADGALIALFSCTLQPKSVYSRRQAYTSETCAPRKDGMSLPQRALELLFPAIVGYASVQGRAPARRTALVMPCTAEEESGE